MAAHLYRALLDEFNHKPMAIDTHLPTVRFATGHSQTFADLTLDDYDAINTLCDEGAEEFGRLEVAGEGDEEIRATKIRYSDQLRDLIMKILPRYGQRWIDLGYPETAEEWMRRKYGGDDENERDET